ncbi:MAG: carboxy terminal-processing peptidase [Burkholderiales bacterium]
MKRYLLWIAIALATAAQGATPDPGTQFPPELKPVRQEAEAAYMSAEVLARYHYKGIPLNGELSEKIFRQYLKSLDPEKLFFTQADIDQLSAYRTKLGDAILEEDLGAPFAIFNLYERRAAQRYMYARTLLKKGFDFSKNESYQYARDKAPWPKTEAEMNELWRKRVKDDWLRLKLAGKNDRSIAARLDERYGNFLKRIRQVKSSDAFETYMNAYTMAIDPHTNYMGPRQAEDFDISMRLSLIGIGAVLTQRDDYVTIRELVPGGPARLSGQLSVGDRIVGVAQGKGGAMTDILGWRLDDAVALIRGAPDSVVQLDVLPADAGHDGKHKLVSLVRKTINLEEQAAKASVRSVTAGTTTHRVGVISLPSFYEDFAAREKGAKDYRSAARDVARLLDGLKKEKVDSVLIDLRNDGGGSLAEAVDLTGLFIGKGPVVQQRDASGEITVDSDTHAGVAWDGPLGVLINRGSASASEIFAAAIQDYGRGLIIGEPSFGKGTVQSVIDLDQIAKHSKPQFGELKLTVAQFFRVNGGTTQLRGVKPDILFPATSDTDSFGESSYGNALPWTQIKAADYSPAGNLKGMLPMLTALHDARVKKDRDFQYLEQDIADIKLQRKKNLVSLNEKERRKERDAREARLRARDSRRPAGGIHPVAAGKKPAAGKDDARRDDGLDGDERSLTTELADEKAQDKAKDVFLDEAVHILSDEVGILKSGTRFAVRAKPASKSAPD